MPRIPIMTSRRPMQRPSPVMPPAGMGTEVSEAVGGLARTVGKVADDWATKRAETEAQNDLVTNRIEDEKNQAEFFKTFQDDPNPRKGDDPNAVASEYTNFMQDKRKDYVWNRDFAKNKFKQTSQLSDVSAIQKLDNLERHKFIGSIRVQGNTNIKNAIDLGNKAKLEEAFIPLGKAYSEAELEVIKDNGYHDFDYIQAGRKLALDPNADLNEFKNLRDGDEANLRKVARKEKKRLKQIADDKLEKERDETEDSFFSKLIKNELTDTEIEASNLDANDKYKWSSRIGKDSSGAKEDDVFTYGEMSRVAAHKEGEYKKFIEALVKAGADKKLKNETSLKFIDQRNKKEKDVGYDEAEKVIFGEDVLLDFKKQAELWVDFNDVRNAEPDKYRGRDAYDLAVKMKEEREALLTEEDIAKAAYAKRWRKLQPTTPAQVEDIESARSDLVRGRYSMATMMGEVIEGEIDSLSKAYDYISKRRLVPDFFKSELQSYAKKEDGILMENKEGIVGIVPTPAVDRALKDGYRKW